MVATISAYDGRKGSDCMKFVKVETGFGGWDEYTDAGQFVRHLTNYQHYQAVQEHIQNHAHDWLLHFSLWWTHHSQYMADIMAQSFYN